jgi:glyceraldehyde-3-phosphate dehydrogenase (NADP+)
MWVLGWTIVWTLVVGLIRGEILHNAESLCPAKPAILVQSDDPHYLNRPIVNGMRTFINGEILDYEGAGVEVTSPIFEGSTNQRVVIGRLAQMTAADLPPILSSSKQAWNHGQGTWPQMSPEDRIAAIERVVLSLKARRDTIVQTLMWEICKSFTDAQAEFDRTMKFIEAAIHEYRTLDAVEGDWQSVGGIFAKVRRLAIGIVLCLGPFNYPFNETYATLIPALLMGNIVIMKLPTTGGLVHMLTMEAYAEHLPPGTLNFVSGSGRTLLPPIMKTGLIDILAFIGGSKAADELIALHPQPHRLKVFLQLEGKNLGVVLPDANLHQAADQLVVGTTSYNGQRCTAIKLIMLDQSIAEEFLEIFVPKIHSLRFGLPWQSGGVHITHLPTPKKVSYLTSLVADAVHHGATVIQDACEVYGETLMRPTLVFGVTPAMRLWTEEQFGPVIPIAIFNHTQEILEILHTTTYGQQASVFTAASQQEVDTQRLLDALALSVGRVNINTQCGRSPDSLPFSGRRSSALGTMSVREAMRTFSVELVLAGQDTPSNQQVMRELTLHSQVLQEVQAPTATSQPHAPAVDAKSHHKNPRDNSEL